ncbi:Syntaxin-81 [Citrus sinensis]|uniref:Syntaxin-81 n=1 Tax=Citrus sinensis TaxID=2711 RepID=A0ACB8L0F1_CITSI|nr:Syntaxin-81 [Citrus sinensis]
MARIRDRTEDFKDVARHTAVSLGYDESKLAAIMASFIIHKPRERSSFTKAALKTLESIGALEQFILNHRKDYVEMQRTTEQERDSIEHEVTAFIKTCKEQIDILQNSINDDEANSKGWLGRKGDNSNADTIAHKHGVVLILSEKLHSVTAQFDQMRAIRFQDAINRAMPRRKLKRETVSKSADISIPNKSDIRELDEIQPEPLTVQQQILDDETRALQVELTSLLDTVQQTETKMVEVSALNHLMSTHILHQARQIEHLYEQPQSHLQSLLCCSVKMVKGRQGERVRLYVRGTILGYKRSKSNQYPNTSLIQIEGVNTKEDVSWYCGKRMAYIYKAKVKKNGSHYRCIWGKVARPHGNSGVVRAKFKSNLPPKSMVLRPIYVRLRLLTARRNLLFNLCYKLDLNSCVLWS